MPSATLAAPGRVSFTVGQLALALVLRKALGAPAKPADRHLRDPEVRQLRAGNPLINLTLPRPGNTIALTLGKAKVAS